MEKSALRRQFFIAVLPPPEVLEEIKHLKDKGDKKWQWSHPPDYHISMAFPGPLSDQDLEKLKTALGNIKHQPFKMKFDSLGYFLRTPSKNKASKHVIWARPNAQADNELRSLHLKILNAMKEAGLWSVSRDFTPHLTVVRADKNDTSLVEAFARAQQGKIGKKEWLCDSFVLCESDGPDHLADPAERVANKSRYQPVAVIKFGS